MLRILVVLLLLANGAWFAWAQGHLMAFGMGPAQQAEPQRLQQQIRPEAVRVLRADDLRRAEAQPRAPECLASGVLDETQAAAVRTVLQAWPAASWSLEPQLESARWIVYMGKYASVDHVAKKRAELRHLGVSFEPLSNPQMEPGLSLGGAASQEEANRQLEALAQRGVRTARVVQERPELRGQRLVLPVVDDALRPRLDELRPAINGKSLRACR